MCAYDALVARPCPPYKFNLVMVPFPELVSVRMLSTFEDSGTVCTRFEDPLA